MAARVDETGREKKAPPPEFSERKRAGKRKARESYVRRCGLVVSPRRRRLGCLGYTRQESIMFMETGAGKEKRLQRRESFARLPKCAFFVFPLRRFSLAVPMRQPLIFFPFFFTFSLYSGLGIVFFISPPSTFLHETSLSFLIEVLLRLVPKKKKGIKDVADWLSRTELDGCLGRGGRCYNTCLGERDWQREGDAIPDLPSLSWGPSCLRLLPRGTLPRQGEYAHS